jgi:hypothetical protein
MTLRGELGAVALHQAGKPGPAFVLFVHMASLLSPNRSVPVVLLLACASVACVRDSVPDPRSAASAYADAAARGDAAAIYAMLDTESRRSMTLDDVRRMVAEERAELADQAKAIRSPQAEVKAAARVRFADGEDAVLQIQNGRFLVSSADAMPTGAHTPSQALEELRRVLARRSYAGLMRVLTQGSRSSMESDLRSLVQGLENPEGLDVQQTGDSAVVHVPGGHLVKLRREEGMWRIEDVD